MGGRQSTPTGTVSTTNSPRLFQREPDDTSRQASRAVTASSIDIRQRARSLSNVLSGGPGTSGAHAGGILSGLPNFLSGSPDSDTDNEGEEGRVFSAHSLPVHILPFNGKWLRVLGLV